MKKQQTKEVKKYLRKEQGITLVALVVTVVILLILAGVSIGTLFGDHGIIKKAQETVDRIKEKVEEEQREVENLLEQLNSVENTEGGSSEGNTEGGNTEGGDTPEGPVESSALELNSVRARIATGHTRWLNAVATPSNSSQEFEWTSSNTNVATVDSTGKITAKVPGTATITVKTKDGTNLSKTCNVTVEDAAEEVTTLKSTQPKTKVAKDCNGNLITVPVGFKVLTGTKAEEGIVIQDSSLNEYVWVPVDSVSKGENEKAVDIRLGRYEDFETTDITGNYIPKQYAENYENSIGVTTWAGDTYEYATYSSNGAGNLGDFVNKTIANGGYYIARYEASTGTFDAGIEEYVYEYAQSRPHRTQGNVSYEIAVAQCRSEYRYHDEVKSDLVNSYAWDTALIFIQRCGNGNYANQTSKNTSPAQSGDTGDEACHIHDMASNYYEWSTEENPTASSGNGVYRGGYFRRPAVEPCKGSWVSPKRARHGEQYSISPGFIFIGYRNPVARFGSGLGCNERYGWNKCRHYSVFESRITSSRPSP